MIPDADRMTATAIHRTDLLPTAMNAGKAAAVRELLRAWRRAARAVAADQWTRFFRDGGFRKNLPAAQEAAAPGVAAAKAEIGAQRLQMVRYQVVGTLSSFLANRQNEFAELVARHEGFDERTRHMLHVVNKAGAWFDRCRDVVMPDTGEPVPDAVRDLARRIMRHVLGRHRRPSFKRVNMVIDRRQASLSSAASASAFPLWLRLGTLEHGRRIEIPLQSHPYFERRAGQRCRTVQVNEDRDGRISVGVVTDVSAPFAAQRAAYTPLRDDLAIDFGLSTLIATDAGDRMGRGALQHLERLDRRITRIARHRQKAGLKVRSRRYDKAVRQLRGWLRTEINRILNRLVYLHRPAHLTVERLDFRMPGLSRRMNRLLTNCGRGVLRAKLRDLEERYGVTHTEVNAAYSSQTCSHCGWVERANRRSQSEFRCRCCGRRMHADVNAARNLGARRSCPVMGNPRRRRRAVLGEALRRFAERKPCHPPEAARRSPGRGSRGDPDRPDARAGPRITLPSAHPQDLVGRSATQ
ncbi:zinc ribbon domain-containing protein [Halorhodospira neutriphila]|nr:zinc ribbon domain-containing protein [Halorhodospira neutriphila]